MIACPVHGDMCVKKVCLKIGCCQIQPQAVPGLRGQPRFVSRAREVIVDGVKVKGRPEPEAPTMLEEAAAQVKDRRATYGSPAPNFRRIADFWNVYWGHRSFGLTLTPFNEIDVATMMRLVKEARLIETPDHRDSLVDIAGYADCQVECVNDAKCSKSNT